MLCLSKGRGEIRHLSIARLVGVYYQSLMYRLMISMSLRKVMMPFVVRICILFYGGNKSQAWSSQVLIHMLAFYKRPWGPVNVSMTLSFGPKKELPHPCRNLNKIRLTI